MLFLFRHAFSQTAGIGQQVVVLWNVVILRHSCSPLIVVYIIYRGLHHFNEKVCKEKKKQLVLRRGTTLSASLTLGTSPGGGGFWHRFLSLPLWGRWRRSRWRGSAYLYTNYLNYRTVKSTETMLLLSLQSSMITDSPRLSSSSFFIISAVIG